MSPAERQLVSRLLAGNHRAVIQATVFLYTDKKNGRNKIRPILAVTAFMLTRHPLRGIYLLAKQDRPTARFFDQLHVSAAVWRTIDQHHAVVGYRLLNTGNSTAADSVR